MMFLPSISKLQLDALIMATGLLLRDRELPESVRTRAILLLVGSRTPPVRTEESW